MSKPNKLLIMPSFLESIQFGLAACCIGLGKCCQWMQCQKSQVVSKEQYEVLCLGLKGVGKSTALASLVGEPIENIEPTTGFNIKTLPVLETTMNIKELGGAEEVKIFWNKYFQGQHGIVFVVNASANEEEEELSKEALEAVLSDSALKGLPCLILVTHLDKPECKTIKEIKEFLQGVFQGRKWIVKPFHPGSDEGIRQGLEALVHLMMHSE
ncbi:ADP-ribosylation factor-like protein 15 [Limulus polyphemus]|uniref:ADP-ribosylation factor-like protein 15 n=1 Tax=Limulus polyphemus TaxID=6850 RepID=A0ABM1TPZ3_LIMPO|nr:ADP-ribosylation factor-like protein 15 [Limulus polyphemus]XP_022257948.1 ADP-ribosylation factor-like protein 15 [Limulus polyphemus]XP_022257949.1 ADP-ribosylation factor-like protein 15 [Limulus polyphemus]XP_022257950.1 ADP-ribosylation factor-like protein 15 [Limulus polyphemus]XP_022257951.1 ADP-ribosylation factor-like protein 15 [Limulus polyphemus]XP_022257952.1 ADP-ribosylation factor-like protein 15 [Limulus polyphemus]